MDPVTLPAVVLGTYLPRSAAFWSAVESVSEDADLPGGAVSVPDLTQTVEALGRENLAGHARTQAALQAILQAVSDALPDENAIGQAASRYNAKMAVVRGD